MHGILRTAPTAEQEKASAGKASELRSLQSQFLHNHRNKIYTEEALKLNAKLVVANPENYTAWNYRKLAIQHKLSLSQSELEADTDSIKLMFYEELRIVENASRKNSKSYGAWHHRKWVLSKGYSSTHSELQLLSFLLKIDSRNFLAWNYRRFITGMRDVADEEELQFTTDMIDHNFSNYSAWHNRSILLSRLIKRGAQGYSSKENVLSREIDFVQNALFTDPDDQSGWFYHLWLLSQTARAEIPLLLSSWPPHGSTVYMRPEDFPNICAPLPFTSYCSRSRTFSIILYFNEAVEGVNSSTVTIESVINSDSDLVWRPLLWTNDFGCSQAWVTHLSVPTDEHCLSKAYEVKITIGHSQGIITSGGVHYGCGSYIAFTVCVPPYDLEKAEGQGPNKISWTEENFSVYEAHDSSPSNDIQSRINDKNESKASEWNSKTISNEIARFRELLSCMNWLLMANDGSQNTHNAAYSEVLEQYRDLVTLDSLHSQYYKDEYSLVLLKQDACTCHTLHSLYYNDAYSVVLLKQVTASQESLLPHCWAYRDSTSSNTNNYLFCLRLNNLSLFRIGSVEQLLWVQMLDLSHNQLRSIEGLEAMQLLSYLNISCNKLGSFTAVAPLRLVKSLKALDISHNEIGAHSIDTRRHLCPSPLSHSVGRDWDIEDFPVGDFKVSDYWEAFSVFRGLNLTQLEILGNPVACENLNLFLSRLLPTLKWIDGAEVH